MTGSCAFVVDLATPKPAPPKAAVPKDAAPKNNVPKANVPKATKVTTKPNITVGPKATTTSVRQHPRHWFDYDDEGSATSVASVSCGAIVVAFIVVVVIIMMMRK